MRPQDDPAITRPRDRRADDRLAEARIVPAHRDAAVGIVHVDDDVAAAMRGGQLCLTVGRVAEAEPAGRHRRPPAEMPLGGGAVEAADIAHVGEALGREVHGALAQRARRGVVDQRVRRAVAERLRRAIEIGLHRRRRFPLLVAHLRLSLRMRLPRTGCRFRERAAIGRMQASAGGRYAKMAGMNGRPGSARRAAAAVSGSPPAGRRSTWPAPFSMGYVDFFTFLIPLYGLSLGLDAAEIGILVGARSILALFLSIHIGVLMDRFGTRAVTLVFVWIGMALAPLFPLAPGFWALLLLQLISGAAVSFAWSGAQTLIAQLAEGDARYIGRFSFFARLGSTSAPIVAGAVWDLGGAWPAYLLGAAWGAVLTVALLRTPEAELFPAQPASGYEPAGGSARATPGPGRPTTSARSC